MLALSGGGIESSRQSVDNPGDGSESTLVAFGGGDADLRMYQDSLGVAFGWTMYGIARVHVKGRRTPAFFCLARS